MAVHQGADIAWTVTFFGLAGLGAAREEPPLPRAERQPSAFDARFMRTMAAHHQVGVDPALLAAQRGLTGPGFRGRFLTLMVAHHEGAVLMCQQAWRDAADPRLRLFASQVEHASQGQLQRLRAVLDVPRPPMSPPNG